MRDSLKNTCVAFTFLTWVLVDRFYGTRMKKNERELKRKVVDFTDENIRTVLQTIDFSFTKPIH